MHIQFGAAVRDITPPGSATLHGYAAREHESTGVSERIYGGCLAMRDGGTTVLFLTLDMIGVRSAEVTAVKAAISDATGVPPERMMVCCSHTHFAPAISAGHFTAPELGLQAPDGAYVDKVTTLMGECAVEALRDMAEGRVETARVRVPSVLFNRRTVRPDGTVITNFRYPDDTELSFSPVDDELSVLRVRTETGVGAMLVNFGCHPVTGGEPQEAAHYQVSSDYVHYLRRRIGDEYGCPVFFTLGSAGDAVPMDRYGRSRQMIGETVGAAAVLAARRFRSPSDAAGLSVSTDTLEVTTIVETHGPDEERSAYDRARAEALERASSQNANETAERFRTALTRLLRAELYPTNRYTIEVQFIRVGTTTFVALPFEVLSEFSLRMKEQHPEAVLVSCANGYQGYLPFAYEYDRGGYEASKDSTHFEPGTADKLLELVTRRLNRM